MRLPDRYTKPLPHDRGSVTGPRASASGIRSATKLLAVLMLAATTWAAESVRYFQVVGDDPGPWPSILAAIGLQPGGTGIRRVYVIPPGETPEIQPWMERIDQGAIVVIEGASDFAASLGIRPGSSKVRIRNAQDLRAPRMPIIWEHSLDLPVFEAPEAATVFVRERWSGAPLMLGMRRGQGAILWVAASPGKNGHERFPYIPQALMDLGLDPPLRSSRLWAFFDASYRLRVDLDYFAQQWRRAGIAGLHVAAWHYFEPDAERDAYLARLIEACHRNGIVVYAWLELPHVSEQFWNRHPEWREKTALLQDAHLDWRKLMNMQNRECFREVAAGVRELISRFDWDGINLAELYFESLEGIGNPARFTPMNDDVRQRFQRKHGTDPIALFREKPDPSLQRKFLEFRAGLAQEMQEEWVIVLQSSRQAKPHLALTLTHVDDRFDTRMRDSIGADAARLMPMLERNDMTFLIEDPATVWHLGPQRYREIWLKYGAITTRRDKLGIDINVVERYQDVYPTKQQTGTELFQLVHLCSGVFPRVALYFEKSILPQDVPLLASAAAHVKRLDQAESKLVVDSHYGIGIPWNGGALVDGKPWPALSDDTLWLPPGSHTVESGPAAAPVRLLDFNGGLLTAVAMRNGVEFSYNSDTRAIAVLDSAPALVQVDGAPHATPAPANNGRYVLILPRGQHIVTVHSAPVLSQRLEP
ncbi:MAG: hypothetical protein LC130_06645 [Bryobacterales bacterium]|nr:hypothetical protein [Bryobacterales bacterium]